MGSCTILEALFSEEGESLQGAAPTSRLRSVNFIIIFIIIFVIISIIISSVHFISNWWVLAYHWRTGGAPFSTPTPIAQLTPNGRHVI